VDPLALGGSVEGIELYGVRDRDHNVALLKPLVFAPDENAFDLALSAVLGDYHPSVVSELQYIALRTNLENAGRISEVIHAVMVGATQGDLRRRRDQLCLTTAELSDLDQVLEPTRLAGQAMAPDTESQARFARQAVGVLRKRCETSADERAAALIAECFGSLGDTPSGEQLLTQVRTALINVMYVMLDLPTILEPAGTLARTFLSRGGVLSPRLPEAPRDRAELLTFVESLRNSAAEVVDPTLKPWSRAAEALAEGLSAVQTDRLGDQVGQWATGTGACPVCAMWFAASGPVALDTTCDYLQDRHGSDWVRIPEGLNRVTCPFCGTEMARETPAVFYLPTRGYVIYCLSELPGVPRDELQRLHAPTIARIREHYAATLSPQDAVDYWAAPELVAYGWEEFLFTVQMGETIAQDHIYGVSVYAAGSGAIHDLTKKFTRYLTAAEVQQRRFLVTDAVRNKWLHPIDLSGAHLEDL
jgi:hypothetical protein